MRKVIFLEDMHLLIGKVVIILIDHSSFGPVFGGGNDIGIRFPSEFYTKFPHSYKDILGKGNSIFNDNSNFILKKIEVFKLIK